MATVGEALITALEARGVDTVFGIPGVHTVEMYRGLATSSIRHVTPRHEQGAGFMADGYARISGRPGVAFVITGPGLTNILTPMAQAYADSVPMLVISSVNAREALGREAGDLHEIRNQGLIAAQAAAFSHTLLAPERLDEVLDRAWSVFEGARPRPVHLQIPRDLLSVDAGTIAPRTPLRAHRPSASAAHVADAAKHLRDAKTPLILAGGGAVAAADPLQELAERLGAPVVMTTNARGLLPVDHPLAIPASPSLASVRAAMESADCLLAVGTEIGRTDFSMYADAKLEISAPFLRIEIDPEQMARGPRADVAMLGDAAASIADLSEAIGETNTADGGASLAKATRAAARDELGDEYRRFSDFLAVVRDTLPDAPIVGDSTNAVYAGNLYHAAPAPRRWFGAATGYGALGYGLPAAVGAGIAHAGPVVSMCGDGGVQFSLAELGCAVEERLPLILLISNNQGYGEIKRYMQEHQITPVGVDMHTPDFVALAHAYGAKGVLLETLDALAGLLTEAARRDGPTVIEFAERLVIGP